MEEIRFSDEFNICGISVLSGTRAKGRTAAYQRGRRCNGFLYLWEGAVAFSDSGGTFFSAAAGDLVLLPKGMAYRTTYVAPTTTFVLVNFELLDKSGNDVALRDTVSVMAKDDELFRIAKLMLKFEQCSASKNPSSVLRRKELCYRLLGLVAESGYAAPIGENIPRQIVAGVHLLRQTYLENLPIERYAEAGHISVNRFRELFRLHFGISPVKYRNRLRLERARELLMEEDLTIAEVAYAAGFENLGYFYRCYQKEMGEMPAETRRKGKTAVTV